MANNTHLARRLVRLQGIRDFMADGNVWTAIRLAKLLNASERTIYRDIVLLVGEGCLIVGEPGTGFVWKHPREGIDG